MSCCGTWLERELLGALDDRSLISCFFSPAYLNLLTHLCGEEGEKTEVQLVIIFSQLFFF